MVEVRETKDSLRADFLAGVLLELQTWLGSQGPAREEVLRALHRWIGTGGTIELGVVADEARALRALTLEGAAWEALQPRCEALLTTVRAHLAEVRPPAGVVDADACEVCLQLAEAELRALLEQELAHLVPAPRRVERLSAARGLVILDGAGTARLATYLARHAAQSRRERPRVLVLCAPGVAPSWIAQHADQDVQFLFVPCERAHLRETLRSLLKKERGA